MLSSLVLNNAIVVIGMPGAGKTTVGTALAQLLRWGFVDIDDLVGDPATIIQREGIDAFRAKEAEVIQRLTLLGDTVISAGGGAVIDAANRDVLRALGPVVWLRATLATLLDRVGDGAGRPLLADRPEAALEQLIAQREGLYEGIATVTVDVDGLDEHEVAVAIVKELSAA
jgi:shikimate kinase